MHSIGIWCMRSCQKSEMESQLTFPTTALFSTSASQDRFQFQAAAWIWDFEFLAEFLGLVYEMLATNNIWTKLKIKVKVTGP